MIAVGLDYQVAVTAQSVPESHAVKRWVEAAINAANAFDPQLSKQYFASQKDQTVEITVRIVSDSESQALNDAYRGKSKPTNVLSFPFEAPVGIPLEALTEKLLGDLVVCHQVVTTEAQNQNKQCNDHYAHMIVHGTLHLLGFDHLETNEATIMESLEKQVLASLGISDPYLTD